MKEKKLVSVDSYVRVCSFAALNREFSAGYQNVFWPLWIVSSLITPKSHSHVIIIIHLTTLTLGQISQG